MPGDPLQKKRPLIPQLHPEELAYSFVRIHLLASSPLARGDEMPDFMEHEADQVALFQLRRLGDGADLSRRNGHVEISPRVAFPARAFDRRAADAE